MALLNQATSLYHVILLRAMTPALVFSTVNGSLASKIGSLASKTGSTTSTSFNVIAHINVTSAPSNVRKVACVRIFHQGCNEVKIIMMPTTTCYEQLVFKPAIRSCRTASQLLSCDWPAYSNCLLYIGETCAIAPVQSGRSTPPWRNHLFVTWAGRFKGLLT